MDFNFVFKENKANEFKRIIKDVKRLSNIGMFKIVDDKFLIYSIATPDGSDQTKDSMVHAIKIFEFNLDDFFTHNYDKLKEELIYRYIDNSISADPDLSGEFDDIENVDNNEQYNNKKEEKVAITWAINNMDYLIKKLTFFNDNKNKVKGKIKLNKYKTDDDYFVQKAKFTDSRLTFSINGGDPNIIKNITMETLKPIIDEENIITQFEIDSIDLNEAKKISLIDTEEENIIIKIKNKEVSFSQSTWNLNIGNIDFDGDIDIIFKKKFIKSIETKNEKVIFKIYENFIIFKNDEENYLISYEKSY